MSAIPQKRNQFNPEVAGSTNNDLISIKSIKAFPRRLKFSGNSQKVVDLDNQ
jgi:hypothetical protein